jgi:hypothetical protein
MPIKRIRPHTKLVKLLDRRQALRGMGVIAVGAPTLVACANTAVSSGGTGGQVGTGGISGTGGINGTGGIGAGGAAGKAAGTGGAGALVDAGVDGGLGSMFDKAATCTLTPTDPAGEGPFFVHDGEEIGRAHV